MKKSGLLISLLGLSTLIIYCILIAEKFSFLTILSKYNTSISFGRLSSDDYPYSYSLTYNWGLIAFNVLGLFLMYKFFRAFKNDSVLNRNWKKIAKLILITLLTVFYLISFFEIISFILLLD